MEDGRSKTKYCFGQFFQTKITDEYINFQTVEIPVKIQQIERRGMGTRGIKYILFRTKSDLK